MNTTNPSRFEAAAARRAGAISACAAKATRPAPGCKALAPQDSEGFATNALVDRHGGAEIIDLGAIEGGEAGKRALRALSAWRPDTLLKKGAISRTQYEAACRLRRLYEKGGFDCYARSPVRERVDQGLTLSTPMGAIDARRAFSDAIERLPEAARALVQMIVLENRTLGSATEALKQEGLPRNQRKRADAVMTLLRTGLDQLAIRFAGQASSLN